MHSGQHTALRDKPAASPVPWRPPAVESMAATLAGTLPQGSQVVVYWIDARGHEGSAEANAAPGLKVLAQRLLAGANAGAGRHDRSAAGGCRDRLRADRSERQGGGADGP